MKITTSDGFTCEVNEDALNDWEIVEKLVKVDRGEIAYLQEVMLDLFGEDGYESAKDHVRGKNGRVPSDKLMGLFRELLSTARDASESKKN